MIYCDTSVLVAALTEETGSDRASEWLSSVSHRPLAISSWSITEFASAIASKQRQKLLDAEARSIIEARWKMLRASFTHIPIEPRHFAQAAGLIDSMPHGLRAGGALHFAIIVEHGCALATFDRDFADVALAAGIIVHPSP